MKGVASGRSQATNFTLVSIRPLMKWTLRASRSRRAALYHDHPQPGADR